MKAFKPVAWPKAELVVVLTKGEHALRGLANRALREPLVARSRRLPEGPKTRSARVNRLLHRPHVYGLATKIPRSRRWRLTAFGHRVMSAALEPGQRDFPSLYAGAA